MNSKKIISLFSVLFVSLFIVVSCVKDTDYELPNIDVKIPEFTGNSITFDAAIASSTTTVAEYTSNDAIEGYVISSDEGGNFYKKIYVQNEGQTNGVSVAIDKTGLYAEYPIGSKVQIRLQGLSTQIVNGKLEIGFQTYTSSSGRESVGNMPSSVYNTHIYNLQEDLKTTKELAKASTSIDELKINDNVNLLVTFENVSFESTDVGKTFHLSANDNYYGTDYSLIDASGKKVIFRTSRYANFAKETVPAGILNITGVLTKYNSSYQFMISNTDAIEVVGDGSNSGNSVVISSFPYTESFDNGLPNGWATVAVSGTRQWEAKTYNGVNYMQMSAYSASGAVDAKAWLITPKFSLSENTNVLKVKIADAYQNGNPLKVVYSADYDGGGDPSTATWTEIGASEIAALINNSGGYDNDYEESGAIALALTGEIYIAFVYESGGSISTTIQLENVYVGENTGSTTDTTTLTEKTVQEIRDMYSSSDVSISDDLSIKVVITSNKDAGNVHGLSAFAQDDTAGIALRFKNDHGLALGDEVTIPLKGTTITSFNGLLQISGVPSVTANSSGNSVTAKSITLAQALAGNYQSQLVSIADVEFAETGVTYSGSRKVTNCTDELIVFTRSQATFASNTVSDKKGTITGNLSAYNSVQLILRTENDVDFTGTYTDCNGGTTTGTTTEKTVQEIRNMYSSSDVSITEDMTITAVVTSDKDSGTLSGRSAFIQDDTAGIALYFDANHSLSLGDEVTISLNGTTITSFNGLIQITGISDTNVTTKSSGNLVTAKSITLAQALAGNYQSQLVSIADVEFTETGVTYSGNRKVTNCTDELTVYTRSQANFSSNTVSDKKGTITGNLSAYNSVQLILRTENDVDFTGTYTDCNGGTTTDTTTTNKFDFEGLSGSEISTSYSTAGTLTASDGTVLAYVARTSVPSEYAIDGQGLMMKNAEYAKVTFPNGVGTFKFKYRGAYTNNTDRQVILYEGDESSTTELGNKTFAFDASTETYSIDLNKTGAYTVTIKGGTVRQIVIDDIEWTN